MSSDMVTMLVAGAGFIGALGVLIKYFGMVNLIAGYDPDRVADEKGLADFIGTNALYVAGLCLVVAVVEYVDPFDGTEIVWIGFGIAVVVLGARMILGSRRYQVSD